MILILIVGCFSVGLFFGCELCYELLGLLDGLLGCWLSYDCLFAVIENKAMIIIINTNFNYSIFYSI